MTTAHGRVYAGRTMTYQDLIKRYGTGSAAAKALGINPNAVYNWKERGIPKPWQQIIAMTPSPKRRKAA